MFALWKSSSTVQLQSCCSAGGIEHKVPVRDSGCVLNNKICVLNNKISVCLNQWSSSKPMYATGKLKPRCNALQACQKC